MALFQNVFFHPESGKEDENVSILRKDPRFRIKLPALKVRDAKSGKIRLIIQSFCWRRKVNKMQIKMALKFLAVFPTPDLGPPPPVEHKTGYFLKVGIRGNRGENEFECKLDGQIDLSTNSPLPGGPN